MTDTGTAMDDDGFRIEHDSLGEVRVPASALWGAQTQRAVENFPVSGHPLPPELIRALAEVKSFAAQINGGLGVIPADIAEAIQQAATAIAGGQHLDQFPVDVFQTGSGTSSNMNANEVIARLASEALGGRPVHPNDHVNASQSSNDVFPSAIHLAATRAAVDDLLPALDHLGATLRAKAEELAEVVTTGRTHLMDAVPVTLGQEIGAWATQVERGAERVRATLHRLGELAIGGTAVGTGLNAPPTFGIRVAALLALMTEVPVREAPDHFEAQGAQDGLVEASGACRSVAVSLVKVANDLRWKASGPRTGLGELRLPDLQPGSSIMPGKVNPVLCEAVTQVAARVLGNDATIAFAGSQGSFELNTYLPVMGTALLESMRLLANVSRLFADRCVAGIEADVERCRALAESSPSLGTALNPYIGYERAAAIVKESIRSGRSVRDIVLEQGLLTPEQIDEAFDVLGQAMPLGRTRAAPSPLPPSASAPDW